MKKIGMLFLSILLCFLFVQSSLALPFQVYLKDALVNNEVADPLLFTIIRIFPMATPFCSTTFCLEKNEYLYNLPW